MGKEMIEEKSKLTYDDRRKELTLEKSQQSSFKTDEIKADGDVKGVDAELLSTDEHSVKVIYTEAGIRLSYKDAQQEKTKLEQNAAQLKKGFEEFKVDAEGKLELSEDLKEFRDKIAKIGKINKAEQAKANYEALQERLKEVKRDIAEIKGAVGTRLKL